MKAVGTRANTKTGLDDRVRRHAQFAKGAHLLALDGPAS